MTYIKTYVTIVQKQNSMDLVRSEIHQSRMLLQKYWNLFLVEPYPHYVKIYCNRIKHRLGYNDYLFHCIYPSHSNMLCVALKNITTYKMSSPPGIQLESSWQGCETQLVYIIVVLLNYIKPIPVMVKKSKDWQGGYGLLLV